jgi:hypothetical protein
MGDFYKDVLLDRSKLKLKNLPYYSRRKTGFAPLRIRFIRLFYIFQEESMFEKEHML